MLKLSSIRFVYRTKWGRIVLVLILLTVSAILVAVIRDSKKEIQTQITSSTTESHNEYLLRVTSDISALSESGDVSSVYSEDRFGDFVSLANKLINEGNYAEALVVVKPLETSSMPSIVITAHELKINIAQRLGDSTLYSDSRSSLFGLVKLHDQGSISAYEKLYPQELPILPEQPDESMGDSL